MSWGSAFNSAWNNAVDSAKAAATAVATGALAVGKAGVASSKWVATKAVDGAKWAAAQTAAAAKWSENTVEKAARAGRGVVIAGGRGAAKAAGKSGLTALGELDEASQTLGRRVVKALDKVKDVFGNSKPSEPVAACPLRPAKDVDFDGTLTSYPGGKCHAVTSKGQKVGPKEIAKAEGEGYKSNSDCCQARRRKGMAPRTILYINGVNTDKKTHCETLRAIGDSTCAGVIGVYNATEGFYRDAVQTSQDRRLVSAANEGHRPRANDGRNPTVDTLSQVIQSKSQSGEPLEIWAHSQGGAVSSLALYDASNTLEISGVADGLKDIRVKSFGAAAPFWPSGPQYEHYVHLNDLTPITYGVGDDASAADGRAGEGAVTIFFSGDPNDRHFETDRPQRSVMPSPFRNHDVTRTYVKMEKEKHAGCNE